MSAVNFSLKNIHFHDDVKTIDSKKIIVETMDKEDLLEKLKAISSKEELNKEHQFIVCVADCETTGLEEDDEIIEFGFTKLLYDRRNGKFHSVLSSKSMLREPLKESKKILTPEIMEITNLTTEMLKGHTVSVEQVKEELADANLIIAHNAKFDRNAFADFGVGQDKLWGCSNEGIPWKELGFNLSQKQESLLIFHGVLFRGHRADADTVGLAYLIANFNYLPKITASLKSKKGKKLLCTEGNTFKIKDELRGLGFKYSKDSSYEGNYIYATEEEAVKIKKEIEEKARLNGAFCKIISLDVPDTMIYARVGKIIELNKKKTK